MRNLVSLFFCLLTGSAHAHSHAWYVGERHGADLLLVEMTGDSCYKRRVLMFGDSVREVKPSEQVEAADHLAWMPWIFNATDEQKFLAASVGSEELPGGVGHTGGGDTVYLKQFSWPGSGMNYTVVDSVEVEGKWYTIHQQMTDDGWVGGRPNAVHQHIAVSDLGIIYSYENWIDAHVLFMLCHEIPEKHRVLTAVYKRLESTNDWRPWKKIGGITARYTFDSCVTELTDAWMETSHHLQLVSASYENVGQEIRAEVTIKNTSDRYYALPHYFGIAPSNAIIHYPNTAVAWNLLDTYHGEHMKQMKQEVYLPPGKEISFSYTFRRYYGCGNCINVTYDGFQVYTVRSYLEWLLQDPVKHDGKEYLIYPHREINRAE